MLNRPRDFVGSIFAMMIEKHLETPDAVSKVSPWSMSVLLETDFYPILIKFENGVTITRDVIEHPTLRIRMSFDTIISILDGQTSMMREFIGRRVKMQGIIQHPRATFRFYRFINSMIGG